ncbi:serine/threonine-protein kinase [Caldimonas taiwanensis]|uniref:serine/threonine-protein kinase n=1 Tax=Caldimonas taiwanensis TaxID=307483 RepID=UPI000783D9E4|nr:serine/threonine-protein kinase [Caldimonas taiwanensis]
MDFQKTIFALSPHQARSRRPSDGRDASPAFDSTQQLDSAHGSLFSEQGERAGSCGSTRVDPASVPPDELPTIGHIGRYALKYRLGEGGLGTVYAAQDPLLSRLVAIKTLSLELSAEARERFHRLFLNEARAVASLNHPHIVTVFDAGTSPQGAYIAMELLKGKDLRQLLKEGWRPRPVEAALIVRRAADALAYAHAKGIIHRDVKPANIFMTGRTQPKVLDFGIARVASQQDGGPEDDFTAGSPYYMAPEQVRHAPVDRRCDVYSLGVVLYELLTGARPFQGATLSEIAEAVLHHQPPPAHEVNPSVPPALSQIVARAMAKDPEQRYRSARALSRELRHWLQEQVDADEHDETPSSPHRGPRWRALALAVSAGVLAGGALWLGLASWTEEPHNAAPAAAPALVAVPAARPDALTNAALPDVNDPSASAPGADTAARAAAEAAPPTQTPAAPATAPARPTPTRERASASTSPSVRGSRPSATPGAAPTAPLATGEVVLAISPWGQVEVNGAPAGIAPPLTRLSLTEGRHTITIRNDAFPPHRVTVTVKPDQPVVLRHKFESAPDP